MSEEISKYAVKGGRWTSNEDEVLKASVMKYGLQNWDRLASIFNQKTAAMCKARWYNYLSPDISHGDWTFDEDVKLLELIKAFPGQWHTISTSLSRTSQQCIDHYNALVDRAAASDAPDSAADAQQIAPEHLAVVSAPSGGGAAATEAMLVVARARLANTLGKKAKRKLREAAVAEAATAAFARKSKELEASGVSLEAEGNRVGAAAGKRDSRRMARDAAFDHEIPFERVAPAGPHAVGAEGASTSKFTGATDTAALAALVEGIDGRAARRRREDSSARQQQIFFGAAKAALSARGPRGATGEDDITTLELPGTVESHSEQRVGLPSDAAAVQQRSIRSSILSTVAAMEAGAKTASFLGPTASTSACAPPVPIPGDPTHSGSTVPSADVGGTASASPLPASSLKRKRAAALFESLDNSAS